MTKSEKIKACIGNIKFNSIHIIVGCTHALVNSVCTSRGIRPAPEKRKRKPQQELKPKINAHDELNFEKGMQVHIEGDPRLWTIKSVGRSFLQLTRGFDKKNIIKDNVTKIVPS
jgi:hypothetical protein